jgi:hypothetical protein
VAETGSGPSKDGGSGTYSTALAETISGLGLGPMLQHTGGRSYWDIAERQQQDVNALPRSAWANGTGPNAVAQNPPLYYWMAAAVYHLSPSRSLLGRIFAVRVMTVGIYVATVALMWTLATEVFARPWQRLLATGVVAFQPKLVAMGAVVNPDALLFAFATGFFWMAVRTLQRGVTTRRMLAMSSFAGAGVLTHGRGLFLLGALTVCLVVMAIRQRPRSFRAARPFVVSIGALIPFILIAALWTRADSGGAAFGGEVAQQTTAGGASLRQFLSYVFQFYFGHFSFLQPLGPAYGYRQVFIDTFFGGFASLEVSYTTHLLDQIQILAAVGLIALALTVARRWSSVTRDWYLWIAAIGFVVSLLGLLHLSAYRDLIAGGDPLITGRYLLPAVSLYGIAIAWVVGSLPRALRGPAGIVVFTFAVALALEGLLRVETRFYG